MGYANNNAMVVSGDSVPLTAQHTTGGTVAPDSTAMTQSVDSALLLQTHPVQGVLLHTPPKVGKTLPVVSGPGNSVVAGGLLLIFCIIALRFRNNYRYLGALLRDLTEVRERHNAFDDTVRETSFLLLLNLLQGCCAGVLLAYGITPGIPTPVNTTICAGLCLAYSVVMWTAYSVVGNVFSDSVHTRMWVRGFLASQGMMGLLLLPIALVCICYPVDAPTLVFAGLGCFILAKIAFIWKGFRIFFTQISSWVLFLYYLCSLEIVPLIIITASAMAFCL